MAELIVGLGERSYPIVIEKGCLAHVGRDLKKKKIGNRYCVIADDRVAELYGNRLLQSLSEAGLKTELLTFPHGEAQKNLATVASLASGLAHLGFDRKDAIITFGGGVSGDIAGFVASSYMRGIPFVQIPTTLLAQVDSSVGGKTGVDIPEGKNLVGAFYQPEAVYIDIEVLSTLPPEELLGGLAEVIKYGVIRDHEFFEFLRRHRESILQLESECITRMIYRCCEIKAEVVAEDEREGGVRRILNYGHTIGHAVEGASDYLIIHGLAVSIGMVAAAKLAVIHNLLSESDFGQIMQILKEYQMPVEVPVELDRARIKKYLLTDKKTVAGTLFFILPTAIGQTTVTDKVSSQQIDEVLG